MTGYDLQIEAGDIMWTYQIPIREIDENDMIDENENNR